MVVGAPLELSGTEQEPSTVSGIQVATRENTAIARIDFAHVVEKQLLVYGWILHLGELVGDASIHWGDVAIDLANQAVRVRRPDVAQHFALEAGNEEHGFYALIDLSEPISQLDNLRLTLTLPSGRTSESLWPVHHHDALPASAMQPYVMTLNQLARVLSRQELKRLFEFLAPVPELQTGLELPSTLPPPVRFEVDLCCILAERILFVYGWMFDPVGEVRAVDLCAGDSRLNFLENKVLVGRPDLNLQASLYGKEAAARPHGFCFAQVIPRHDIQISAAKFSIATAAETVPLTYPVFCSPQEARREFLTLLSKVDSDGALVVSDCVAPLLDDSPESRSLHGLLGLSNHHAVGRLPAAIHRSEPRYFLHVDHAIPIADTGIFLAGWFNAESAAAARVVCHCAFSSFVISDHWIRTVRTDVTAHLASLGIPPGDEMHGYCCYVPLWKGDTSYYLSVEPPSGDVCRMRVSVSEKPESALQTVRALLSCFSLQDCDLPSLMERQLGPAVVAAWAARRKPAGKPSIEKFGEAPADPLVSVIVPLYGRHDFVEYQIALFADDPEFQGVELIYVVDDPTIFHEFRSTCADVHGIYQVPFVVASSGANLGFAGANNFGSTIAQGKFLLFMNSDVLPKRPGWVGKLLRTYLAIHQPGLLGAKLVYEDGSIQHVGMVFRRYQPWGGLWINDHPFKGQSALGLSGVHEVDAVTGACALIEGDLYRELGGFSEDYIVGDFEDSDLCLRAAKAGRRNWVVLDVELYHLERQSQSRVGDAAWRANLTAYNCWRHHQLWADFIARLSKRDSFLRLNGGPQC